MITAVDTNIFLDILVPNEKFFESSMRVIEHCASIGGMVAMQSKQIVEYLRECFSAEGNAGCHLVVE